MDLRLQKQLKRLWPKTRKQLIQISDDAFKLARKGEKQLTKLSKKGKAQLELSLLSLKKEQLFYKIGREAARHANLFRKNKKLEKMHKELAKVNRGISRQRALIRKKR